MAKNNNLTDFLTDIANHFRDKLGLSGTTKINPQNFSDYVDEMPHLVDISEQFPDLAVNIAEFNTTSTISITDDFPWKTLADGSNFLPVVVFHAVLSYKFSEAVGGTGLGVMTITTPRSVGDIYVAEVYINGDDTNLHTESCWFGEVVNVPTESNNSYDVSINFDPNDPNIGKCTASIKVTPYIVKIGDRVLSLQTCKGEA